MSESTEHHTAPTVRPRPPTVSPWLAGLGLVACTGVLAAALAAVTDVLPRLGPGYSAWQDGVHRDVWTFLLWFLGDATEAEFFKSALGAVGLVAGGLVAHLAQGRGARWAGFPISYGTGLWPWVLLAAAGGLLLSELAWSWTIPATGMWQPTFVPFVSVPPAIVLVYGAGWRVAATAAVAGAATTTPIAIAVVNGICRPAGLPEMVGSVTGMWAGALLSFALCRALPWMSPAPAPAAAAGTRDDDPPAVAAPARQGPAWVVRRVLADFTEAQFYGNELAALGLIGGTVLAYLLNPESPAYGSMLLPGMLLAQVLTATIGVLVHRRRWASAGWYPTFVPVVSVAPTVVLTYGATPQAIVAGAVVGALAGPPLGAAVGRRLPPDFHPFIGNVVSMTVCVAVLVPVLVPVLGLFPGFVAAG